jgi:hypothetical protein
MTEDAMGYETSPGNAPPASPPAAAGGPDWSDPRLRAAVLAACDATEPVELSTAEMTRDRGFGEGSLLDTHVDALARAAGVDRDSEVLWSLSGDALRRLVNTYLIGPLAAAGCTVSVGYAYRNPARARWVNGLSCNEEAIPRRVVQVSGVEVGAALLAVLGGKEPAGPQRSVPSALEGGLSALVGRHVEVATAPVSDEALVGRLVGVGDNHLVLARDGDAGPTITIVPLTAVVAVSTRQLTESEDVLFDD